MWIFGSTMTNCHRSLGPTSNSLAESFVPLRFTALMVDPAKRTIDQRDFGRLPAAVPSGAGEQSICHFHTLCEAEATLVIDRADRRKGLRAA